MAIATINPATGEVIKTFPPLSDAEIEKKLQLSVSAFKSRAQDSVCDTGQAHAEGGGDSGT